MTRPKRTKADSNQPQIMEDCRDVGMIVWDTHDLATPVLDMIAFWRSTVIVVEVKPEGKGNIFTRFERGEITLTESEMAELASMRALEAVGVPVVVAETAEDVIEAFLALDEPRWRVVDQEAMRRLNTAMGDALTVLGGLAASAMSPMRFRERIGKALNSLEAAHDLLCQATQFK